MKLKYIIYAVIVLGLAYLIYYRISANKKLENQGPGKGDKAMGQGKGKGSQGGLQVEGIVASTSDFASDLEITGTLEANEAVELHSEVPGLVTSINFKEGSTVSKGSLLLKINDRDI